MRQNYGFNEVSQSILEGTFVYTGEESDELIAFFKALRRTDREKECQPVLGEISRGGFQGMFDVKRESTSSDSRDLNYTQWRCLTRSNYLSDIFSVLISLPFMYGFINVF